MRVAEFNLVGSEMVGELCFEPSRAEGCVLKNQLVFYITVQRWRQDLHYFYHQQGHLKRDVAGEVLDSGTDARMVSIRRISLPNLFF